MFLELVLGSLLYVTAPAIAAPAPVMPRVVPPAPAALAAAGRTTGTIVRREIAVPWACGGEVSIVQVDRVDAPIRRIVGVSTMWSTNRDRLIVAPFAYVTGPSSAVPALTVTHFDITDEGWISLLEGRGKETFYGDRSDSGNDSMCSGARCFLWLERDD
jgi:hypothetical protein